MFFGVGANGVSLPRYAGGTNWSALVIGLIAVAALALTALSKPALRRKSTTI
jgi:hypothetical protein